MRHALARKIWRSARRLKWRAEQSDRGTQRGEFQVPSIPCPRGWFPVFLRSNAQEASGNFMYLVSGTRVSGEVSRDMARESLPGRELLNCVFVVSQHH